MGGTGNVAPFSFQTQRPIFTVSIFPGDSIEARHYHCIDTFPSFVDSWVYAFDPGDPKFVTSALLTTKMVLETLRLIEIVLHWFDTLEVLNDN
jgi:hypothetical protein